MIPGPSSQNSFPLRLAPVGSGQPEWMLLTLYDNIFSFCFVFLFCKSSLTRKIPRPIHHLSFSSSTSFIPGSIHALSSSSETIRSWIFLIHQWQWVGRYRRFARESCRPPYFCLSFFFFKCKLCPDSSSSISLMVKNETKMEFKKTKKQTNLCISAWSRTIKERNSTPCAWWICTRRIKKIRGEKKLFFQLSHFLIIFDGGPSPPYPPNQCDQ